MDRAWRPSLNAPIRSLFKEEHMLFETPPGGAPPAEEPGAGAAEERVPEPGSGGGESGAGGPGEGQGEGGEKPGE